MKSQLPFQSADLFEVFPEMLFVFDEAGNLFQANPSACDMFGFTGGGPDDITFSELFEVSQINLNNLFERVFRLEQGQQVSLQVTTKVTSVALTLTLIISPFPSKTTTGKYLLIMAYDDRKLRAQFVKEKKDLWHAQLMKRIRLHEDIASLTAHEFAQPLGALRLELDHLLARLKRSRQDELTQDAIEELQPLLATMDHLIAERQQSQQGSDEDSIDAVDLRRVIGDVERFYRHRFQANGREICLFSDVDQAVVFANHRVLLHIILEVVSFLDQQIDDRAMNFEKTLHLALTETLSGWFCLTFYLKRKTSTDLLQSDCEVPSTLYLLTECCSELLGSYGIVVTSRFTLKGQRLVFTLPRHDQNEFSQLHTLASDINPRIDNWLSANE